MPFYLEDGLSFIGVLHPGASYARKAHAIVERERRPPTYGGRRTSFIYSLPREYQYALCGGARWYTSVSNLVRDGRITRTEDISAVTCKHCKRVLEKYLGRFDLSNPDWEI
jgi:hypothetical protein